MSVTLHYKIDHAAAEGFLFVTSGQDYQYFIHSDLKALPALGQEDARAFLSAYNHDIKALYDANPHHPFLDFIPLTLRNTWQSGFYQGSESYARLKNVTSGNVYCFSPAWFLHIMKTQEVKARSADIKRAKRDCLLSSLKTLYNRYQGFLYALSKQADSVALDPHTDYLTGSVWTQASYHNWCENGREAFLGNLPTAMTSCEIKPCVLFHREGDYALEKPSRSIPAHPIAAQLRLSDWLKLGFDIAQFRLKIGRILKEKAALIREDIGSAFSAQLPLSLLSYYGFRRAFERCPKATLITPYENNCWEIGALKAAKEAGRSTCGIQHTSFSPSFLKMDAHFSPKRLPDSLYAAGAASADILIKNMGHAASRVKGGCALRQGLALPASAPEGKKSGPILILLQGAPTDGLVLNILRNYLADEKLVIRSHPAWPLENIHPFTASLHQNLADDISQASIVLYNGTTAVFDALLACVPIIWINDGAALSADPLFELQNFRVKRVWTPGDDFSALKASIEKLSEDERKKDFLEIHDYIQRYFSPATPAAIDHLIKNIENE